MTVSLAAPLSAYGESRPLRQEREPEIIPAAQIVKTTGALPASYEPVFVHRNQAFVPEIGGVHKRLTKKWIAVYSTPAKLRWLSTTLERGEPYMAFIRREIEKRGLPTELIYLPVLESEFFVRAKSRSGAVGIWQFMTNSVHPYMEIDDYVDERYDFWKSTEAALSKLESNYRQFGDWALALAAYNMGAGAVSRAIKQTGEQDYWKLADMGALKPDTVQYVPKFLAIAEIIANPRQYGLDVPWHGDLRWARVDVPGNLRMDTLAAYAGLDPVELCFWNSELLHNVTPPWGHTIKVQESALAAVTGALRQIALETGAADGGTKLASGNTKPAGNS
jgi:membrane-bound lytic murein transglycosylase D